MAIIQVPVKAQLLSDLHAEKVRAENKQLREQLRAIKQQAAPTEGAHLVVNGEVRRIGKKSQYLLDMLILPEDK